MPVDDHMLYTICIDALPAKYEVEAEHLASRDLIGRDDIIQGVRVRHHRLPVSRNKVSNAGHAVHALYAGGGCGGGGGRGERGGNDKK